METEQTRPRPPPPPLAPPPPPPPPPLGLSSMQASLTNFLARGRSTPKISPKRPAAVAVNFVDKHRPAVRDLQGMGLTGAMRALDSLRKHGTTASEGDVLGASGRLDVQDRAGLLVLCGCQRGCRFTSDEMNTIQRATHGMAKVSALLELQFGNLAPKIRGNQAPEQQEQRALEEFYRTAETWLVFFDDARALATKKQAELRLEHRSSDGAATGAARSPRNTERAQAFPAWLSTLIERYRSEQERMSGSNAYVTIGVSRTLLEPARVPPPRQRTEGCHGSESNRYVDGEDDKGEAEPLAHDSTSDAGITVVKDNETATWLCSTGAAATAAAAESTEAGGVADEPQVGATASTAQAEGKIDGSAAAAAAAATPAPAPSPQLPPPQPPQPPEDSCPEPHPAVDSLAKFCRFLALLVASVQEEGTTSTTGNERAALEELIQASDDGSERTDFGSGSRTALSSNNNSVAVETGNRERGDDDSPAPTEPEAPPVGPPGAPRPLRYWGKRIHRFMLSIRELRAVPERDLAALDAIMSEVRRGGGRRGRSLGPSPLVSGE